MSECLPQVLQCNGHTDCPNGADEQRCGDNAGWADLFGQSLQNDGAVERDVLSEFLQVYPQSCDCIQTDVKCVALDLQEVPQVSPNVTWLSLRGNKIQALSSFVLAEYAHLERLIFIQPAVLMYLRFLSQNLISSLSPGVFMDLHQLQWLVLDHNPLRILSQDTFIGLQSLKYLSFHLPGEAQLSSHKPSLAEETNQVFHQGEGGHVTQVWILLFVSFCRNISYNPLLRIHPGHFDHLIQLQSLALEGIEIPEIETKMFLPMKNLSHIYFKTFQYCSYAPHVRSCKPNTDGISSFEDLLANVVLRVSVWVIAFITCFGNLLVIGMRSLIRAENNQHAACIKVLCCADCLMGVYLFFLGVSDVKFRGEYNRNALLWMESVECRTIGFLAMLSSEVSVLLLTYLTLEKFLVIVFPFSNLRPSKPLTGVVLASIWLLGVVIAAVPLMNEDVFGNYYGRNGVCFPLHSDRQEKPTAKGYSTGIFLGLNLVAFLIIVFSYSSMFYSIYKTGINATDVRSRLHRDVAVANRFFFIVFSDALCWIPIFLVKILSLLEVEIPDTISSWVVIFILPINSALNPILYTLTTSFFREQVEVSLCRWQRRHMLKKDHKSLTSSTILMETPQISCYHLSSYLQRVSLKDADPRYA
uniref:Relaxin family peptide receptor 2 n=1 Tax=Takifugu rubripes TaxID=31033 RepID=A0A674NJI6_TAKRU